jgi:Na+/H+-dicarboxylate symporter
MEKRAGIPNRICSFILPLGTTVNLAGTALYCMVAVIFIAQATGGVLSFANLLVIGLMGLFTSLGMVAGIPSASLVTIVVILQTVGLPAEAVALLLPAERLLDMCRTTVNVFTNSCSVALVNRFTNFPPTEKKALELILKKILLFIQS